MNMNDAHSFTSLSWFTNELNITYDGAIRVLRKNKAKYVLDKNKYSGDPAKGKSKGKGTG